MHIFNLYFKYRHDAIEKCPFNNRKKFMPNLYIVLNRAPRTAQRWSRVRCTVATYRSEHSVYRNTTRLFVRKSIVAPGHVASITDRDHIGYSPVAAGIHAVGCFRKQRHQRLSVPGHTRLHGHPSVYGRSY